MSERITCPWCEKQIDVDAIETAGLWKERGLISVRIKPIWRIAVEYMDAFASEPGSRIMLKRKVRHLWGLVRLWETCEFEYDGKRYRTTQEAIKNGMLATCEAQKTGFNNHNYLFKCLLPTAQRLSAEGKTAAEEEKREVKRRSGPSDAPDGAMEGRRDSDDGAVPYHEYLEQIKEQSHTEDAEDAEK